MRRNRHTKAYRKNAPWTDEDEALLITLVQHNYANVEIAKRLDRSFEGIKSQVAKLLLEGRLPYRGVPRYPRARDTMPGWVRYDNAAAEDFARWRPWNARKSGVPVEGVMP